MGSAKLLASMILRVVCARFELIIHIGVDRFYFDLASGHALGRFFIEGFIHGLGLAFEDFHRSDGPR